MDVWGGQARTLADCQVTKYSIRKYEKLESYVNSDGVDYTPSGWPLYAICHVADFSC
jgi:hypothetical protein